MAEYIETYRGNMPIIISVPHGGMRKPEKIPKRTSGILGVDKVTIALARDFIKEITRISGKQPSYLISKVHRNRIDLNRSEKEAFDKETSEAREIYRFYHNTLTEYIYSNIKTYGHSLLVDIHGFEKNKRPPGFRDVEIVLGTNNLCSLFENPVPKKNWNKNVRGKIIKKFLELKIPIAPGHPRRKEYILTGGYITMKYGANKIPKSQAIQIEFSDNIRLYNSELRKKVLKALSELLIL